MENRQKCINKAVNKLEKDMDLLGVSGVEDKLQDNVERTIGSLKQAGI
jgi:magnesium-transporting ATPase (P-type)